MNVTILGAAGFLGLNLVDELLAANIQPRCGRRTRTNVIPLRRRGVPLVHADLDDPATLRAAMADSDAVFHAAGHYPRHSLDPSGALDTALRQTRNLLDSAAEAGVGRLVYVSSTATAAPRTDGSPSNEADVFAAAPGFGTYHDVKWAMEDAVLAEDRFPVTVACPGACIGPWDLRVGTSALVVGAARGDCPPVPTGLVNTVYSRDVARALLAIARHPDPARRVLLSGQTIDVHELLHLVAARHGAPPPPDPMSADEAIAFANAEESRVHGTPERPGIARELVDLIIHAVELDTTLAETALDMTWTPLAEALDAFEAWARRFRILPALETAK